VVVGGGLAGLVAAYRIRERRPGIRLLLLEARERLGGRILSEWMQLGGGRRAAFDLGRR
jgi:protoporphyrinogen oxidase